MQTLSSFLLTSNWQITRLTRIRKKMTVDIDIKLLLLLSMLCLDGLSARGGLVKTAGSGVQGIELQKRKLLRLKGSSYTLFNVKRFGALTDGLTDDAKAFTAAWKKACGSTGTVNLLIPKGSYLIGSIRFAGPCQNVASLTVHVKGHLKATTDLSEFGFSAGWVEFGWVEGLTLIGGGTFDGQGFKAWPYNNCPNDLNCKLLPPVCGNAYSLTENLSMISECKICGDE